MTGQGRAFEEGAAVRASFDRRRFLIGAAAFTAFAPLAGRLAAAEAESLGKETVAAAEALSGLEFTDAERELLLDGVREMRESYRALREVKVPNAVAPALVFEPLLAGVRADEGRPPVAPRPSVSPEPAVDLGDAAQLAFLPVTRLAKLLRAGEVTSEALTHLYLDRLKSLDPHLECVITLTEERAFEAAARADAELAAGRERGFLHGIPWGAKDLLAVAGYPTTWGAMPFRDQRFERDAAVVRRLDEAGAVLLAKLSLGALAWGDVWFGGQTKNPWNLEQGSSGSSAGSAAATAAGCVAFAIGSETWGSIVSPATRCGATGLRPTFGRVSRDGAMALSWSMDKLGPLGRSVEDCALLLEAICGVNPDETDSATVDRPFAWDPRRDHRSLRVGWVPALFEDAPPAEAGEERRAAWEEQNRLDRASLEVLRGLGWELVPVELPALPVDALTFILSAEAAAAFDELTRSGRDDELVRQVEQAWPNVFRQARLIPAVEYIQANRVRALVMQQMEATFAAADLYVAPSFGGSNLLLTNLTGHPAVVLPNGFRADGTPGSISFIGRLFGEEKLLLAAKAYQDATDFHLRRPPLPA